MNIPETSDWYFVFRKSNDIVSVGLEGSKDISVRGYLAREPLKDVYECEWSDIRIDFKDFEDKIVDITKEFINQVTSINAELVESNNFKRFISSCNFEQLK